ncbi:MAG: phosphoglycerate dehydrogenase [Bacteroidota bacterium]
MRVLVTDNLDPICRTLLEEAGIEAAVHLKQSPEELKAFAPKADGWIVRSGTKITADLIEVAQRLRVIGRAGVGVDNIDLAAATRRGILVLNAPDGNTVSTAEHACAMMLALARQIPQAAASLKGGAWERAPFSGAELDGKTLGIVGVGKIGRAVARRMQSFGMRTIGFDPVLSPEAADRVGVELVDLAGLWAESEVITLHAPLNDATRHLINDETLAACREGVYVVNCARGGIVDEAALLRGLESGQVGGAALDVYSQEPPPAALDDLVRHPRVVGTPHIAASTDEAQEKVARQVTQQVIEALHERPVSTPVNAGAIRAAAQPEARPFIDLADRLGRIVGQIAEGQVRRVTVRCYGETTRRYAEVLTVAALRGILTRWSDQPVNLINAPALAREMGLAVDEQRHSEPADFTHLVEVALETDAGTRSVMGTVLGEDDARLVGLDRFRFEAKPEGHLLFYQNVDRPGMLATVGGLLAQAGINIASLALGRDRPGETALTAIGVDEPVPRDVVRQVEAIEGVEDVRVVHV